MRGALLNTRSLQKHSLEIFTLLQDEDLDILALTETWLGAESEPDMIAALPQGYCIQVSNRPGERRGGGVALITRSLANIDIIISESLGGAEVIGVKVSMDSACIVVVVAYRPPGPSQPFNQLFLELMCSICSRCTQVVVLGDFNYWLDEPPGAMLPPVLWKAWRC